MFWIESSAEMEFLVLAADHLSTDADGVCVYVRGAQRET